ncbi:RNA polymerase sigma-70 factor [Ravibacter arvi]|uniref:RNA polymerase sigma-70 factor n=1 Tax=Ravibacter arvi TaxID=2051041 RepID=A0ABP8LVI2_9BACT
MGRLSYADDQELLARIGRGDAAAFDVFYERYWKFVFNAAYKRLSDREAAGDISQEVFSQLWTYLHSGEAPVIDNVPGYLYVAVRNHVFKWMEKEKRFVPIPEVLEKLEGHDNRADAGLLFEELLAAYRGLVAGLPEQQRLIFQLRYDEGMSSGEIASQLHLSEKTVRNQIGRALGKMKSGLAFLLVLLLSVVPG